jgi:hypothetical protein
MEKPVQRDIDRTLPLRGRHARQHRIVMDAGVMHEHLDRGLGKKWGERRGNGMRVGEVEDAQIGRGTKGIQLGD